MPGLEKLVCSGLEVWILVQVTKLVQADFVSAGGEVGVLFFLAVLGQLLSQGLCCQADMPVQHHLRGCAWHSWTTKNREKMKIPLELPISLKINEIIRRALERRMCVCACICGFEFVF